MDNKHIRIILFLEASSTWVTSKEISHYLGCSNRTIKSYIQQINEILFETILSSKQGYKLNDRNKEKIFKQFLSRSSNDFQTLEGRRKQLTLELLKHNEKINIFDLGEILYISTTTLKSDISKLNEDFQKYDLKIVYRGDYVEIIGLEKNKRKIFIDQVYYEYDLSSLNVEYVQQLFPAIQVQEISDAIAHLLHTHNLFIDEYALTSVILHITIMIDRISKKHILTHSRNIEITDTDLFSITKN